MTEAGKTEINPAQRAGRGNRRRFADGGKVILHRNPQFVGTVTGWDGHAYDVRFDGLSVLKTMSAPTIECQPDWLSLPDVECPACGNMNDAMNEHCYPCGEPLS